jgi:hypothetical protein
MRYQLETLWRTTTNGERNAIYKSWRSTAIDTCLEVARWSVYYMIIQEQHRSLRYTYIGGFLLIGRLETAARVNRTRLLVSVSGEYRNVEIVEIALFNLDVDMSRKIYIV